jgi:NAD(P)H-dependent FMN reductase
MRVLAFAASNSRQSINQRLVRHAADVFRSEFVPAAEIELLDLNDYDLPLYSIDRETEGGIPERAQQFYDKIGAADAVLVSYAEHNGSYTAAFKNIFDWASRIDMKVFQGKPMVILSASIGKHGGAGVMRTALDSAPYFGADVRGHLSVGPFSEKFDDGRLTDDALAKALRDAVSNLPHKPSHS